MCRNYADLLFIFFLKGDLVWGVLLVISFLFPMPIYGATNVGIMDIEKTLKEQDELIIQDQTRLRYDRQIRDQFIEENRIRNIENQQLSVEGYAEPQRIESELPSFTVTDIIFDGAQLLSPYKKKRIKAPYLNKKISMNEINILVHELTNIYIRKGYITTRVYIPKQNLKTGTLVLAVQEGFVADFKVLGINRIQLWGIFPPLKGKSLNIRHIEQGLDQLNRLQSNHATVKLIPSEGQSGGSVVFIQNRIRTRGSASIRYDTLSNADVGVLPDSVDLSYDNLLRINDQWFLNYSQQFRDQEQYNNSYSLSGLVPFRYLTLKASYSQFDYLTIIQGLTRNFNSSGKTKTFKLGGDRVIFRNSVGQTLIIGELLTKDTESFIEDTRSDVGSRKLVVLSAGINHSVQLKKLGSFRGGINYFRGISRLNAIQTDPMALYTDPKAQFKKFTGQFSWRHMVSLFGMPFQLHSQWRGQYSYHTLYASERMSIGDFASVKGYRTSLHGDHGLQTSNTITYFPFRKIERFNSILGRLSTFHSIDGGIVLKKGGRSASGVTGKGSMMGVSSGLRYGYEGFSIEWTWSKATKASAYVDKPSYVTYLSVTKRFI